jgi:hypothetical protein
MPLGRPAIHLRGAQSFLVTPWALGCGSLKRDLKAALNYRGHLGSEARDTII